MRANAKQCKIIQVMFLQNSKKTFGFSNESLLKKQIKIPSWCNISFFYLSESNFLNCLKIILQNLSLIKSKNIIVAEQDGNAGMILCLIKKIGLLRLNKIVIRGFISNERGYHIYDPVKFAIQQFVLKGADAISVFSKNEIKLFPNPTENNVMLEFNEVKESCRVQVVSITGSLVMEQNYSQIRSMKVELPSTAGIYFVRAISGSKTMVFKVVKR